MLIEKSLKIEKELYLSIIPDRATAKIVIIASNAGGMDIEEVAANQPEKIIKIHIDPLLGIQPFHCRQAAFGLKLPPSLIRQFTLTLINFYRLFVDYDCTLVEINPLAITADENIVALDAKIIFDWYSCQAHLPFKFFLSCYHDVHFSLNSSSVRVN